MDLSKSGLFYCDLKVQVLERVAQHSQVPGLPGLHHRHRGQAARRAQHGSCRLRPGDNEILLNLRISSCLACSKFNSFILIGWRCQEVDFG